MRHLTLVPRPERGVTSPQRSAAPASPATPATPPGPSAPEAAALPPVPSAADTVAHVPVKLLLAASGRCSCDDCAREALRERQQPPRAARGTDRQPVRNLHLLS